MNTFIPFTLRNEKAVEHFPILHGHFQSLVDSQKNTLYKHKVLQRKCCNVRGMIIPHGENEGI